MNLIRVLLLIFSFILSAIAQTERFTPDSTAMNFLWKISDKTELYVGASFYYIDPSDSIVVWLDTSESDKTGDLYMMIPEYSDSAMFLFSNEDVGNRINVTRKLGNPITPGTEIFFMYKRQDAVYPKFTGQNRKNIDPVDHFAYPGADFVSKEFDRRPGYGYRWSVAGRVSETAGNPTDTVIFGFEDMIHFFDPNDTMVVSDRDFNDVIFRVTGLKLNVEKVLDSIQLIAPDSVNAGDTILCNAVVWFDSSSQKTTSHNLDTLLNWNLSGYSINHDTLLPGATSDIAHFLPRTAFENFTISISLVDPLTQDTIRSCKTVRVYPGKPASLSIELRADTASTDFNFNNTVQISRILIPSNSLTQIVYAVFRDRLGNFSGFSPATSWDTTSASSIPGLSSGCATVSNGNLLTGEGVVKKVTNGNILVLAKDVSGGDTLKDTVLVNISFASYDSLRIGRLRNLNMEFLKSLTISTDSCTHFEAQGRRIDNGKWESLRVSWYSLKWQINTGSSIFSGTEFCPEDTGNGFMEIQYQGYLKTRLPIKALPGAPFTIKLYTDAKTVFPSDTFAQAGKRMNLSARVLDKNGIWLKNIVMDSIFWSLTDDSTVNSNTSPSALLDIKQGGSVKLSPLLAYRHIKIIVNYGLFTDSVNIAIRPGDPYRVVIESHANWHRTLHSADEIDTVEIPDNATSATVYALLRDSLGNYVDSLREGSWIATDTIINIQAGTHPCNGIITKNLQVLKGITSIIVTTGTLSDTAYVKLLPYHFTAIRITDNNYNSIDSLIMSTNQDTILRVQGLRSDTIIWRDILVDWSKTDTLIIDPECPFKASSFIFSPVKPGSGAIFVHYPAQDTLTDTIAVIFTRGDPVRAEIQLLTSTDKLIAGDTIYALVTILNKDGLVPGEFCPNTDMPAGLVYYTDSIGYGGRSQIPIIASQEDKTNINELGSRDSGLNQCFTYGKDTVGMVLYYAPFSKDSLHKILLQFGDIKGYSNPFRIKPSTLDSLSLAHTNKCCTDSLLLRYPDEQALIYAMGYDKYGNMRGGEACTWRTTGTLHQCDTINVYTRIIYAADSTVVSDDESGTLIAISEENKLISDTLRVVIVGPLAKPVSAITKDLNGNGILDRIEIRFDMPIYKNSKQIPSYFWIDYNNLVLPVDSISISKDSTALTLFLDETSDSSSVQTDWTPLISFFNNGFALGGAVDSFIIEAKDGAGPVIESVIKEIRNDDRYSDVVRVNFSEEVTGPQGSQFSYIKMPEEVLRVYTRSSNTFTELPFLTGIKNFNAPINPDFVYFTTSNGKDLNERYFLNLRTDKEAYVIEDLSGNKPSTGNRKVQVEVRGTIKTELLVAPNPSRPSGTYEMPGEFHLVHNPHAIEWVVKDRAGTVITFQIQLPKSQGTVIGGQLVILDMMGNTVISDPETDFKFGNLFNEKPVVSNQKHRNIIPSTWQADGTIYEYMIYWNGYTKSRMKAAPGVYRAVLKIITKSGKSEKVSTYVGKIGIKP